MLVSIVIPIYNEEGNIDHIYEEITRSLDDVDFDYEVIMIDDGSSDSSCKNLTGIVQKDDRFKLIELRRNYGQTAAMMAGFNYVSGQIVVSMDGDMQNDPQDIPMLVGKILEGYDVCSGWRKDRKDKFFRRNLPSRIANWLISFISGVKLHDYGCTLKAYRREILEEIRLYGEMHRFIPIYASWQGAAITEIPVIHHPRIQGDSKYGMERIFKVILDLMFIRFFSTLSSKPMYVFGGFGLMSIVMAFLCFFIMVYFKYSAKASFIETPLPQLVVLFFLVGFITILMGFNTELLMRTYYESQGKSSYSIKKVHNLEKK